MQAAARLTAAAALSTPWFSTSAKPADDGDAGMARTCSGVNLPTVVPAEMRSPVPEVTQSPVPEVTQSPVLEGKQEILPSRRSPSSVVPSPLSSSAKPDSKRRFSKVEKRDSPSPFSVRPLQIPCFSSPSIFAASDRASVVARSRQLSLDERLSLEYGLPQSPQTAASGRSSLMSPMSEDLDDALPPRTDELGKIDDISMRSPISGAILTSLPEEFALLEGDATNDDMTSVIETWKADQAAGGVADASLDNSRASTVCRGLQGLGLDKKHSEPLDETQSLLDHCGQAARGQGCMHSYSLSLASIGQATDGSGAHARVAERETKPGAPTPSVSTPEGHRADDETESLISSFGRHAATATTASDGQQPISGGGEFEGGDLDGSNLEHHLNILHMIFLHTLLEDEELSAVQRKLICRHLQGTCQLQAQLQGDDIISMAATAAMADVPTADSAAAAALMPMPGRRLMRACSSPLVTVRSAFSDKRQEPRRRAWTDSLTADERVGVLRKGLRTMFREYSKTPLTSGPGQQNEQRPLLLQSHLPTTLYPNCRVAPNQRTST